MSIKSLSHQSTLKNTLLKQSKEVNSFQKILHDNAVSPLKAGNIFGVKITSDKGALSVIDNSGNSTAVLFDEKSYDKKTRTATVIVTIKGYTTDGDYVVETYSYRGVKTLSALMGYGNDSISNNTRLPSYLDGGDNDDVIVGGIGSDTIVGGKGRDYMAGMAGRDIMDDTNDDEGDYIDGGYGDDSYINLAGDNQYTETEKLSEDEI